MGEAVLVVEHEELTRRFLSQQLTDDGFEVFAAECGAPALELVEAERPDLVLLDAVLPDVSGFDLCSRLRAGEAGRAWNRDVPVIIVSARSDPVGRVRDFARGADDYVVKASESPLRPLTEWDSARDCIVQFGVSDRPCDPLDGLVPHHRNEGESPRERSS